MSATLRIGNCTWATATVRSEGGSSHLTLQHDTYMLCRPCSQQPEQELQTPVSPGEG